jgi:hypothetical protein
MFNDLKYLFSSFKFSILKNIIFGVKNWSKYLLFLIGIVKSCDVEFKNLSTQHFNQENKFLSIIFVNFNMSSQEDYDFKYAKNLLSQIYNKIINFHDLKWLNDKNICPTFLLAETFLFDQYNFNLSGGGGKTSIKCYCN